VKYLSALREQNQFISPALTEVDDGRRIVSDNLIVREDGEVITAFAENVT
jgi:DNA-directed RNA polymerase subunit beta